MRGTRRRRLRRGLTVLAVAPVVALVSSAAGAPTLTWRAAPSDPAVSKEGQVTNLSCTPGGACLAVGLTGQTAVWKGGSWRTAPTISRRSVRFVSGLSCVTPSFCVAVGSKGDDKGTSNYAITWTGGAWGAPVELFRTAGEGGLYDGVHAVSCTDTSFCMAIGGVGSYVFDGTRWTAHSAATGGTDGQGVLSCSSELFCANIHDNLPNYWNGSSWRWHGTALEPLSQAIPKLDDFISQLSCVSSTFCVAVDPMSSPLVWNGRSWRYSSMSVKKPVLTSVSCTTTSFCVATSSQTGLALEWNGAAWRPTPPLGLRSTLPTIVSCATTGRCLAVDDVGATAVASS